MARPIEPLNQEMANRICELVASHSCGLRKLCSEYPELPDPETIRMWRVKHESFRAQYAEAKRLQLELMTDDIEDEAESVLSYIDKEGNSRIDAGSVNHQRLKVDTKKWLASKLAPKIYGDKPESESVANTLIEKLLEKL